MRKLLLFLLLIPLRLHAQATQIVSGPVNPPTCNVGMLFNNTSTTPSVLYFCGTANTWTVAGPTFSKGVVDPTQSQYAGGMKSNWVVTTDGTKFTVTSGSASISCTTCNFSTTATPGMKVLATNWNGQDTSYTTSTSVLTSVPTILTVNSNTSITISSTATGNAGTTNSNVGAFAYGTDDTAAIHAAKVAAFDGPICLSIQMPAGVTYISAPEFNTAACVGMSGGSTTSKYPAVLGWGLGGPTTILVGPDFSSCTTQCFGGVSAQWYNISFNGLGNSSMNPFGTGVAFFGTSNDGSYAQMSFWGIGGAATNLNCVLLGGGYHIFTVVTIDGCGGGALAAGLRIASGASAQTIYSGFVGNTTASLILVPANAIIGLRDWSYIMSAQTATGIAIDCAGTCSDFGGNFINSVNVASSVYQLRTGATLALDNSYAQNNANSGSNVVSFFGASSGLVKVRDSRLLQGGSSGGVFGTVPAGGTVLEEGGNVYSGPIGLAPTATCTGCGASGTVSFSSQSTNERGNFSINAAGAGPAATGTIVLTQVGAFTISGTVTPCTYTYATIGGASWSTSAIAAQDTAVSTTSRTIAWNNNGTALVAGNSYQVEYVCGPAR